MKENIKKSFEEKYLAKYPDKKENDHQYYYVMRMLDESLHEGLVNNAAEEINKNISPLNTPLLALMHDTAHDLDTLRDHANKMTKVLKEKKDGDARLWVSLEYIRTAHKSIMDQIDEYYIKNRPEKL